MAKSKKSSSSGASTDVYSVRVPDKALKRAVKKKGAKGLNKKVKEVIINAGK